LAQIQLDEASKLLRANRSATARSKIIRTNHEWNTVQQALYSSNGHYGLRLQLPENIRINLIKLGTVQHYLSNYFMQAALNDVKSGQFTQVAALKEQYDADMSSITTSLSQYAEVDLMALRREQKQLAFISAIVLLCEMLVFVLPYHRKLLKAYREVKIRKRQVVIAKRITENLNHSLNLMVAGINAGVWEHDFQTGKERWSTRLYRLLDYEETTLPASFDYLVDHLLHPDDKHIMVQAAHDHLANRTPYMIEVRIRTGGGTYRWFEISGQARWDINGNPMHMAGSIIDIHQTVQHLRELEYNDFMLDEIGKMAQIGGWEYVVENNEIRWTKSMYKINELDDDNKRISANLIGNNTIEHQLLISNVIKQTRQTKQAYDAEMKLTTHIGNERWVRVIATPVFNSQHKITSIRGVYQDVHKQKLYELELEQARAGLLKSNETKDKLLSIIAHDLRTPVNNMRSIIDMQQAGIISQEEFVMYIDNIKTNIDYLSTAMDNMLTWAFGQMNGFKSNPDAVNLCDVGELAIRLYKTSAEKKNITLSNDSDNTHLAFADRDNAFLVIRNLLNNAIKFTPEGGLVKLVSELGTDTVRLSVQDNGRGISRENIEKILQRSTMYTTAGTSGEKGTGLGLDLCMEMAAKDGGTIEIESEPGQGSSFTLILPSYTGQNSLS
jgi:PAS domain S-box